ncbi:MAG: radical SAM protein, partial [bacterium]
MNISKCDALQWFEFFSALDDGDALPPHQQELALATLSQIEAAEDARIDKWMAEIPGLKSLNGRTCYVGPDERFPKGCRSCLLGTGLSAVRKTNKCNLQCPFCYDYGEMDG